MQISARFIQPDLIHVWKIHLSDQRLLSKKWTQILSAEEINKANSFHFPKDLRRFTASHVALRMILAAYLRQPPDSLNFVTNNCGKPFLADSGLRFNLSHSGEIAAAAISGSGEIGVDVEQFSETPDCLEIARKFFSETEIEYLEAVAPSDSGKEFFRIWTRKEAFIKATSKGLSASLQNFSVIDRRVANDFRFKVNYAAQNDWHGWDLELENGYAAALVVNGKRGRELSFENLNSLFQTSL